MTSIYNFYLFVLLSFSCILIITIIPIYEMYVGIYYMNDIICETSILNISIPIWLIVKSSLSFFIILLVYINIVLSSDNLYPYYILYITYIFNIFWVIIGSIIFWKDCSNITPYYVNTFIWFDLIFSYATIFNNFVLCRQE